MLKLLPKLQPAHRSIRLINLPLASQTLRKLTTQPQPPPHSPRAKTRRLRNAPTLPASTSTSASTSSNESIDQSFENYMKDSAPLSPFVPCPELLIDRSFNSLLSSMKARRGEEGNMKRRALHVDLGSGDGRVNFYFIDRNNANDNNMIDLRKSIGIETDINLITKCKDKVASMSSNSKTSTQGVLEFKHGDLSDGRWWLEFLLSEIELLQIHDGDGEGESPLLILTMFFVPTGLLSIEHTLNELMRRSRTGSLEKGCRFEMKVITYGYRLPCGERPDIDSVSGSEVQKMRISANSEIRISDDEEWMVKEIDKGQVGDLEFFLYHK